MGYEGMSRLIHIMATHFILYLLMFLSFLAENGKQKTTYTVKHAENIMVGSNNVLVINSSNKMAAIPGLTVSKTKQGSGSKKVIKGITLGFFRHK